MTIFPDYEKLVLEYYHWKKTQNELSSQLIHPTTANIKGECVRLCKGEIQKKDEKVIRDFCQELENGRTCLHVINNCDVDKFRPLLKILKKGSGRTNPKNIELLAWLIDFPLRPFVLGKVYPPITEIIAGEQKPRPVTDMAVSIECTSSLEEGIKEENRNPENHIEGDITETAIDLRPGSEGSKAVETDHKLQMEFTRKKGRLRNVAMVGVLLTITGTAGLWWRNATPQVNGGCMYWAKDHFQPIPCSQSIPNALIVALDTVRVKNFRKITRPDTITNRAKGNVWYSKINNEIEFFTADGGHPVVIGRRLKPVSDYIINKYAHSAMSLKQ